MIGTKLAHYEITQHLGTGGMGEVYQATDTKLGRSVAIKLLPEAFTHDDERVARLEREARVLASLNHSNIAAIYGVEDAAGRKFLVMELAPGETLESLIRKGPVPLEDALAIARQIAEALEAAHENGIVHRDLKPANVKVTPEGKVKVLDFGLAKALDPEALDATLSNSPTRSIAATQRGIILGTAAYMAPEQARGRAVDKRADIWAFGVILYEMLTGSRLFNGEDISEILAAVIKEQPSYEAVPMAVRRLIRKCLEKDRTKRLRDIGDVWELLDEPASVLATPAPQVLGRRSTLASKAPWLAATVFAIIAAITLWAPWRREPASGAGAIRFTVAPPEGATMTLGAAAPAGPQVVISPDGRYIAFVADEANSATRALWVRPLGSLSSQKLDKTENANLPFWSPDSQHIAFFANNELRRIPVSGGSSVKVADAGTGEGGTWMQDAHGEGVIIFAANPTSALQRVPAAGGVPTPFTKLAEGEAGHIYPQFLPDGKRVLYFVRGNRKPGIYVQTLGSEERTFVLKTAGRAVFAPPNFLLFVNDATLMAQRFDPDALISQGEPVSVADEVRSGTTGRNAFSVSNNGVLVYRAGSTGNRYQLTWYTRDGKPAGVALPPGNYGHIELSPDDKRIVVRRGDGDAQDMWLLELETSVFSRLTSSPGAETQPVWAPDSQRIAFVGSAAKGPEIRQTVIGSGLENVIYADGKTGFLEDWTRAGKQLLIRSGNTVSVIPAPEEGSDKAAERKPQVVLDTPFVKDQFRVSPDGKWVVYNVQDAQGTPFLNVAAFPSFANRRQITAEAADQPLWRSDGKEIFFNDGLGNILSMEVKVGTTFETGPIRKLFHSGLPRSSTVQLFAATRDGQRFLVLEPPGLTSNTVEPLYVIANWPVLLKK